MGHAEGGTGTTPVQRIFERVIESFAFNALIYASLLYLVIYLVSSVEINYPIQRQLVIGWSLVAILLIIYKIDLFQRPPYRIFFILFAGMLSLRYFVWRVGTTLIPGGPLDTAGMLLLFAAEAYAFWNLILGMFINIWPVEHVPDPMPAELTHYPTIDIYIPTYSEPEEIVRITAVAAKEIDYPKDKFNIFILNDGSTIARRNNPKLSEEAWMRHFSLKRLAQSLGIGYITRETNQHAKAGNINHALMQTKGDIVLILDCDHVPTRDILKSTVGCFLRDPKLFLVQTPHFFINPSPVERNMDRQDVPYESDMFFRVMQCGFNTWNASYFCGSAALLRRSHLMEVGGVAGASITEDAETSVVLHSRGLNSAYVNKIMVCGLSPETFDDYILQRTRWCQGMLQIFVLANPMFRGTMSFGQRLCYFNCCLFWFFSFARLTFFLAPGLFLILGLKVYHATLPQIVAYAVPHLFAVYMIMFYFYGRYRMPFISEIYESVQSIFLFPAIISVMLNPRKPTFKITPKGKKTQSTYLNHMASTFFLVVLVNLIALPQAAIRWVDNPLYRDVIILATTWCLYNIVVSVSSLGAFWEKKQVRRSHRIDARGPVTVRIKGQEEGVAAELQDMSLSGLGVLMSPGFTLRQRDEGVIEATDSYGNSYSLKVRLFRIIPKGGGKFFCGFDFEDTEAAYSEIVKFVYGDSQKWVNITDMRSAEGGGLKTIVHFMKLGLSASREAFWALIVQTYMLIKDLIGAIGPAIGRAFSRRWAQ